MQPQKILGIEQALSLLGERSWYHCILFVSVLLHCAFSCRLPGLLELSVIGIYLVPIGPTTADTLPNAVHKKKITDSRRYAMLLVFSLVIV